MENITPKEKILKKIRAGLLYKKKNPFPDLDLESNVFRVDDDNLVNLFAQKITENSGHFIYCHNYYDFVDTYLSLVERDVFNHIVCLEPEIIKSLNETGINTDNLPGFNKEKPDAAISSCEALVARNGSILLSSLKNHRTPWINTHVHIVLAFRSQLVYDIKDAFLILKNKYGSKLPSSLFFVSGPAKTADIEAKVILTSQGPEKVFVFLIDDQSK